MLGLARKAFAKGLTIDGKKYDVQIIDKDGQSDPRARPGRRRPDQRHEVDLMLTTSTPEKVNPVSDACEAAGVPCISTVVPWEAWYFGRGREARRTTTPFKFVYHFCFGVAAVRQRLHHAVAAGADQQEGRRDVAQRRRWQRHPRRTRARC